MRDAAKSGKNERLLDECEFDRVYFLLLLGGELRNLIIDYVGKCLEDAGCRENGY